jgi:hypothetical protein
MVKSSLLMVTSPIFDGEIMVIPGVPHSLPQRRPRGAQALQLCIPSRQVVWAQLPGQMLLLGGAGHNHKMDGACVYVYIYIYI